MYIESLIRLAEILSTLEEKDEFLISEKFHAETEELVKAQSKFLENELRFKESEPGPYNFGIGENFLLTVFSPDQTEETEWAAVVTKKIDGKEVKTSYRFNSMYSMIKTLKLAFDGTSTQTKKS